MSPKLYGEPLVLEIYEIYTKRNYFITITSAGFISMAYIYMQM